MKKTIVVLLLIAVVISGCSRFVGKNAMFVEIDAGTNCDEKQSKQQSLEGLDIGFQFVTKLAVGEHDACEEGAECRRQAYQAH